MNKKRKNVYINMLVIILMVLAVFPTMGSITGDGFSWKSFAASRVTEEGATAILNGDSAQLENAIGFSGTRGSGSADEMRTHLDTLRGKGIQIVAAKSNLFSATQEDRFPLTAITLTVRNGDVQYQISCVGTVASGKLMLIRFDQVWKPNSSEPLAENQIPTWVEELEAVLCTYSPG